MTETEQLLADYVQTGSETAFRELVDRYVNLVYSAAVRLVNGDFHMAEDVTQTVFADLARTAGKISSRDGATMLGGWLHRHTCFVASNIMRGERRRQFRERQAVEMNASEDHSEENLALIAPVLDDAINQLAPEDRAAILLRFFEQKDFQSVGTVLGSNEDAARKRVSRALDKLHALLTRCGVVLSATALTSTLTAQAVTAAPAGLALSVSTAALATAAAGTGTALTFLQIMSMTKLKVGIASIVVAALAIPLAMQYRNNNTLRQENEALRRQAAQIEELATENERLSNMLADAKGSPSSAPTNEQFREVLKLRGEVGRLNTAVNAPKPSPISGVISDPAMRKAIRDQQKMGMTMIYKGFTNRVKMPPEQMEKFVDVLADDIMASVDHVGTVLRDGKSQEEMDQLFTEQEAALREKVKELLGPEGFAEYQDYTRNMGSYLTAEGFKSQLSGDKAEKDKKAKQLHELIQEERQNAISAGGLSEDFQTMLILNFRNIASEQEAEKNLKIVDTILDGVAARAPSFLSQEDMKKFTEWRSKAIEGSRMSLTMNRKMMAPSGK